jgi:hypothetical protein
MDERSSEHVVSRMDEQADFFLLGSMSPGEAPYSSPLKNDFTQGYQNTTNSMSVFHVHGVQDNELTESMSCIFIEQMRLI